MFERDYFALAGLRQPGSIQFVRLRAAIEWALTVECRKRTPSRVDDEFCLPPSPGTDARPPYARGEFHLLGPILFQPVVL